MVLDFSVEFRYLDYVSIEDFRDNKIHTLDASSRKSSVVYATERLGRKEVGSRVVAPRAASIPPKPAFRAEFHTRSIQKSPVRYTEIQNLDI